MKRILSIFTVLFTVLTFGQNIDPFLQKNSSPTSGQWNQGSLQVDYDFVLPDTIKSFTNPDLRDYGKLMYDKTDGIPKFFNGNEWVSLIQDLQSVFEKGSTASISEGDISMRLVNSEIRQFFPATTDSIGKRAGNFNFGSVHNINEGEFANIIFQGDSIQYNAIYDNWSHLNFIAGYDNKIYKGEANFLLSMHGIIDSLADHSTILGGSFHHIQKGSKSTIVGGKSVVVGDPALGGTVSGAFSVQDAYLHNDYQIAVGGSGKYLYNDYTGSFGGRNHNLKAYSGGSFGGQTIDMDNSFSCDYSVNIGGLNNSAGTTRSTEYSMMFGRSVTMNGNYSFVGGFTAANNGDYSFTFGRNVTNNGTGNFVICDGSGTGLNLPSTTNKFGAFYTNGYRLDGGNVGIGLNSNTATARLHLPAGTTTANTAPLKFNSGTIMTSPEAGTIEYNGTDFYITTNSGRKVLKGQEYIDTADAVKVDKVGDDDIEITDPAKGLILEDTVTGTRYRIQITNGVITANALP